MFVNRSSTVDVCSGCFGKSLFLLILFGGAIFLASDVQAASIGINMIGGGGPGGVGASLLPTDIAGVAPQGNYNNIPGGSGTFNNLIDSTGAATTVDLSYSGGGIYTSSGTAPVGANEKLNTGFVYGTVTGTVSQIPYAQYNVFIYLENDAGGRFTTTTLNGGGAQTFTSIAGSSAGQVDGSGSFTYLIGANSPNSATGNYVAFLGVTGSSFTFATSAPGNGSLSGMQIVDTTPIPAPEPASLLLLSFGTFGLLRQNCRRNRKCQVQRCEG